MASLGPLPEKETHSQKHQQRQGLNPKESLLQAGISATSAAGRSLGKLHNLRFSAPSDRTRAGWFPGGARLGHFPKLGSTLRPHPEKPMAPLVQGFGPSGQARACAHAPANSAVPAFAWCAEPRTQLALWATLRNRAVASAVFAPCRAMRVPNPGRPLPDPDARASPPPPPLPGAGIPATCSRDRPACRGRMTRKQEQPLGGARAPRLLARFSFAAPGPGLDAACSCRARAPVNRLTSAPLQGATLAAPRGAGARLGPLPHG